MQVHWFLPERRVCKHPAPCLTPANPGSNFSLWRRCSLANVFLLGSAHAYFKNGVRLSLGHYRVSSLAFAPIAEKQVQCNALEFLNSC